MNNGRTTANDSGATTSTWMSEKVPSFDQEIDDGVSPEVCVIGAGIAGLSVALSLVQEGIDVLVIDQGPIGGGQTARTSAHLASAVDDRFYTLEKHFGRRGARLCAESHAAAIDAIEQNTRAFAIDCQFRRVDGYLWRAFMLAQVADGLANHEAPAIQTRMLARRNDITFNAG